MNNEIITLNFSNNCQKTRYEEVHIFNSGILSGIIGHAFKKIAKGRQCVRFAKKCGNMLKSLEQSDVR